MYEVKLAQTRGFRLWLPPSYWWIALNLCSGEGGTPNTNNLSHTETFYFPRKFNPIKKICYTTSFFFMVGTVKYIKLFIHIIYMWYTFAVGQKTLQEHLGVFGEPAIVAVGLAEAISGRQPQQIIGSQLASFATFVAKEFLHHIWKIKLY